MKLDIDDLRARHPKLPTEHAADLALHTAVALDRQNHQPGVALEAFVRESRPEATLHWTPRAPDVGEMLDPKRMTEFGAEAIALALVNEASGWVTYLRLREGESADWLLKDKEGRLVALEISGTASGDAKAVMRKKLAQVSLYEGAAVTRTACVIRFQEPAAWIEDVPAQG